jgi:hypothetical protein
MSSYIEANGELHFILVPGSNTWFLPFWLALREQCRRRNSGQRHAIKEKSKRVCNRTKTFSSGFTTSNKFKNQCYQVEDNRPHRCSAITITIISITILINLMSSGNCRLDMKPSAYDSLYIGLRCEAALRSNSNIFGVPSLRFFLYHCAWCSFLADISIFNVVIVCLTALPVSQATENSS